MMIRTLFLRFTSADLSNNKRIITTRPKRVAKWSEVFPSYNNSNLWKIHDWKETSSVIFGSTLSSNFETFSTSPKIMARIKGKSFWNFIETICWEFDFYLINFQEINNALSSLTTSNHKWRITHLHKIKTNKKKRLEGITLFFIVGSAPLVSNNLTTSSWPNWHAIWRGVAPF